MIPSSQVSPIPQGQDFVLTNNENPLPSLQTSHTSHPLMNSSHHHASKHGTNLTRNTEESSSLLNLFRLVPGADDVHCARVCACFCEAEEEADDTELGDVRDSGAQHCHSGPEDDHGWKPDARLDFLDDDAVGKLANGHSGGGDGENIVVVVATHVERLTKTGNIGIGKGSTV